MTHAYHSRCGLLFSVVALCFLASAPHAQEAATPAGAPAIPDAAPLVTLAAPPAPTPAIPDAAPAVALAAPAAPEATPPAPTPVAPEPVPPAPVPVEAPPVAPVPAAPPVPPAPIPVEVPPVAPVPVAPPAPAPAETPTAAADPGIPATAAPVVPVLLQPAITQVSSAELLAEPVVATAESVPVAPPGALVSLFFSASEREAIAQAKKQFASKATKEESEEDLLDQLQGIKATKKKEQDLQEKYYAQFYLQTIMYHTPEDWTAWVKDSNGTKKYTAETPSAPDGTLRIIVINKEDVTFEWRPKNWPYVMNMFKQDNPLISLDANRQVVIFTLTVNQTMFSYDMQIKEGVVSLTPVAAQAPAPDAKKEESKKEESKKEEAAKKEAEEAAKNTLPDPAPADIKSDTSVMTPAQVKKATGGILGLYKNLEPVDPRP